MVMNNIKNEWTASSLGRLAAITCIFVYAKCCHPHKIKSLLTYLLTYKHPFIVLI